MTRSNGLRPDMTYTELLQWRRSKSKTGRRFTHKQVWEMRIAFIRDGLTARELASHYETSASTVRNILQLGRSYADVPYPTGKDVMESFR